MAGMIESLIGHSACQASVADKSNDVFVTTGQVPCQSHTECGRDRGTAVPHGEGIVRTLIPVGET